MQLAHPEQSLDNDRQVQGCIDMIRGDYDMEYAMYLIEKTGIFAESGTASLIENLKKEAHL